MFDVLKIILNEERYRFISLSKFYYFINPERSGAETEMVFPVKGASTN